jgi:hypothetical protein
LLQFLLAPGAENRLDINYWRPIDGLDRPDSQTNPCNFAHRDWMKPEWIWPVRRARRKHSGETTLRVRSRMDLEYLASCAVKPGDDKDLIARPEAIYSICCERPHFKPCFGRAF